MANGQPWQDHVGYAIACPPEWPFGTKLDVNGEIWECMDRGSKIQFEDGIAWVDFLIPSIEYPYGAVLDAILIRKGE